MTTAIPSLDALPPVVIVRGIAHWLGLPDTQAGEPEDALEALCERLSKGES